MAQLQVPTPTGHATTAHRIDWMHDADLQRVVDGPAPDLLVWATRPPA